MAYSFPLKYVKLASTTVSVAVNSVSFTSLITSNFSTYYVAIRALVPVTDNTNFLLIFSTDNGVSYLNSNYLWGNIIQSNTTLTSASNSSDSSIQLLNATSNVSTGGMYGDLLLYNMNNGTQTPRVNGYVVTPHQSSSATAYRTFCQGINSGTTAVTAVLFKMSSGQISSGTISFYGVSEP
jgi:hypothetical protein